MAEQISDHAGVTNSFGLILLLVVVFGLRGKCRKVVLSVLFIFGDEKKSKTNLFWVFLRPRPGM